MTKRLALLAVGIVAAASFATPAAAEHPLCTHRDLVEYVICQLHPVTDLLGDGGS